MCIDSQNWWPSRRTGEHTEKNKTGKISLFVLGAVSRCCIHYFRDLAFFKEVRMAYYTRLLNFSLPPFHSLPPVFDFFSSSSSRLLNPAPCPFCCRYFGFQGAPKGCNFQFTWYDCFHPITQGVWSLAGVSSKSDTPKVRVNPFVPISICVCHLEGDLTYVLICCLHCCIVLSPVRRVFLLFYLIPNAQLLNFCFEVRSQIWNSLVRYEI